MDLSKLPKLSNTAGGEGKTDPADELHADSAAGQNPRAETGEAASADQTLPPRDGVYPVAGAPPVRASAQHEDNFCRQCGLPVDPFARFCGHCGAALTVPTPPPPPQPEAFAPSAAPPPRDYPSEMPGGMEGLLNIGIGIFLLFMQPRLIQYWLGKSTWNFQDANGNAMAYVKTIFFWNDICVTTFALVLVLGGLVLLFLRKWLAILAAMILTVAATLLNLWYVGDMFHQNYGFQLLPGIVVLLGLFTVAMQWSMLQRLK